jgi:hypothetical protein
MSQIKTCIHGINIDIECDLCWDQVEYELALEEEKENEQKTSNRSV